MSVCGRSARLDMIAEFAGVEIEMLDMSLHFHPGKW
jgi:hypothetical protein